MSELWPEYSAFSRVEDDPENPYNPTPPNGNIITISGQDDQRGYDTAPAAPAKVGGGGGVVTGGGDIGPEFNFSAFPRFNPRNAHFSPLSFEDAQNEPGYKFGLQAGRDAIERSAAAKGILRTGGNLKDLSAWSDNFATQNYGQANQRALQTFMTNYGIEKDMFAPLLAEATARFQAEKERGLAKFNRGTIWGAPRGGGGGGGYPDLPPKRSDYDI